MCLSYSCTNEKEVSFFLNAWTPLSLQYLVVMTLPSGPLNFCYFLNQSMERQEPPFCIYHLVQESNAFLINLSNITKYRMISYINVFFLLVCFISEYGLSLKCISENSSASKYFLMYHSLTVDFV